MYVCISTYIYMYMYVFTVSLTLGGLLFVIIEIDDGNPR